ncbi:50S ribosomal protein L35 [Elusimicrobiota bacterium]
MRAKNKNHTGSKKRFKITGKGKVKRSHATAKHLMTKKSPKQRRKLRKSAIVEGKLGKEIKRLLGN